MSGHKFVPHTAEDSRSPCPALNALANHGYLSHSGKKLTVLELVNALNAVYHISIPLALMLSLVAVIVCGNGFTVDLHDLSKTGLIEHPGSLVHADCAEGEDFAPSSPSQSMLRKLLRLPAPHHGFSIHDFASARAKRDSKLHSPLDFIHSKIALGESALAWLVMKNNHGEVPNERMEEWLGEERLPEGWTRPATSVGLVSTGRVSGDVAKIESTLKTRH